MTTFGDMVITEVFKLTLLWQISLEKELEAQEDNGKTLHRNY